jgi:hypothetical protein
MKQKKRRKKKRKLRAKHASLSIPPIRHYLAIVMVALCSASRMPGMAHFPQLSLQNLSISRALPWHLPQASA